MKPGDSTESPGFCFHNLVSLFCRDIVPWHVHQEHYYYHSFLPADMLRHVPTMMMVSY